MTYPRQTRTGASPPTCRRRAPGWRPASPSPPRACRSSSPTTACGATRGSARPSWGGAAPATCRIGQADVAGRGQGRQEQRPTLLRMSTSRLGGVMGSRESRAGDLARALAPEVLELPVPEAARAEPGEEDGRSPGRKRKERGRSPRIPVSRSSNGDAQTRGQGGDVQARVLLAGAREQCGDHDGKGSATGQSPGQPEQEGRAAGASGCSRTSRPCGRRGRAPTPRPGRGPARAPEIARRQGVEREDPGRHHERLHEQQRGRGIVQAQRAARPGSRRTSCGRRTLGIPITVLKGDWPCAISQCVW